ncbi:hypothetical protein [Bacillus cereus]|uniref:hypothetical protein n=1 Tax=Bacillus cereus TaxID=1396 RepID=UPI00211D8C20|nr:hypothetical protein [Bacillus cereus]
MHRKNRIGICPYCQLYLFKPLNILQFTDHKDYYISQNIEVLFKENSKENSFSIHALYENLSFILQSGFNGNIKQFANYIGVPKTTVWGWLNKEVSIYLSETEKEQFGVKAIIDIAKDLKYSTKFLYNNFPEECKKISERNYRIQTEKIFLYV